MKKLFFKPEIRIVEIDETQIICDSGQPGDGDFNPYLPGGNVF